MDPANEEAVDVFDFANWQYPPGGGGPVGLDYGAAVSVARGLGVGDLRDCLLRLQVLESAALEAMGR